MGHLKRHVGMRGLGYAFLLLLVIAASLWGATYVSADEFGAKKYSEPEAKTKGKSLGMESKKGYRGMHDMAQIKKDLDAAVESGRITEEQADERIRSIVEDKGKSSGMKSKKGYRGTHDMAQIKKDLDAAVESGRITEEQADERMRRLLESLKGPKQLSMMDANDTITDLQEKIEDAVRLGNITRADADEKHQILREKMKSLKKE